MSERSCATCKTTCGKTKQTHCVSSQWVPEISHHCPRTPFLLVGTQVDLRDDSNTLEKLAKNKQRALTCESGEKLARELKAVKYVECSALTQVRAGGRIYTRSPIGQVIKGAS